MNAKLGHQATRGQQLLLATLIEKRSPEEVILIHHVTDVAHLLQMEVERRCPVNGIQFQRIIL